MKKIYYEIITFKSVLKKNNWNVGGHAITFMSGFKDGKNKMEVSQFGKTKEQAEEKLIKFLNGCGKNEIECIGKF